MAPDFRKLWKKRVIHVPWFRYLVVKTANSEFEVLCGFPVVKDNVKYERQLLNAVPCLPHILADKGYRTVVSHPNAPVFWNRVNAYRNIGFQNYWSIQDVALDEINREFLSEQACALATGRDSTARGAQPPVNVSASE